MNTSADTAESDKNFEELENLKVEFQKKVFIKAIENVNSPEARLALELIKASSF